MSNPPTAAAQEVIAASLKEQGATYPNAGAHVVLAALEAAGFAVVQLPQPARKFVDDLGRTWEWCGGTPDTWKWRITALAAAVLAEGQEKK